MFPGMLYLKIFKGTIHRLSTNGQIPLGIWYINMHLLLWLCKSFERSALQSVQIHTHSTCFSTLLKQQLPFPDF